jgi:hypothetical protein
MTGTESVDMLTVTLPTLPTYEHGEILLNEKLGGELEGITTIGNETTDSLEPPYKFPPLS